ncbi:MAG TPA: septal ring lytic transglycosylase RlpA family protein [Polyangiaceae bacterium]|nr:septal ring lytic transglycosylase RlpA family protein [Polyangiaceae bacterium]
MRRQCFLPLVAALALGGASGCAGRNVHYAYATAPAPPPPAPPPVPPPALRPAPSAWCESGSATYYADFFKGRRTASGERYDPRLYSAAHRTLPLGTTVVVSRLGRSVRVRVNDRGPYARGAVIDLSRAAAEALDMVRAGRVQVTVCRG